MRRRQIYSAQNNKQGMVRLDKTDLPTEEPTQMSKADRLKQDQQKMKNLMSLKKKRRKK